MLLIKQGLHPDPVAGKEQSPPALFPHGEGKNAVQLLYALRPELGVGMEQHLRVGVPQKAVSQGGQLAAQLLGIVQLPVVNQRVFLPRPGKGHGLTAALRVNDGKPPVEQRTPLFPIHAPVVRPPAMHRFQHPANGFF